MKNSFYKFFKLSLKVWYFLAQQCGKMENRQTWGWIHLLLATWVYVCFLICKWAWFLHYRLGVKFKEMINICRVLGKCVAHLCVWEAERGNCKTRLVASCLSVTFGQWEAPIGSEGKKRKKVGSLFSISSLLPPSFIAVFQQKSHPSEMLVPPAAAAPLWSKRWAPLLAPSERWLCFPHCSPLRGCCPFPYGFP